MTARAFRIPAFATGLVLLFEFSRRVGEKLGNGDVPGLLAAVAALGLLFTVRAIVTESALGSEAALQKDFLWGLSVGCWTTVLLRTVGAWSG